MKRIIYSLVFVVACSTSSIYSDYDRTVDFSTYKTFAWLPNPVDSDKTSMFNNQIVENNVKDFATREMQARGYTVNTSDPDLMLEYNMGVKKKERTIETPIYQYPYNYNWSAYPYYDPYRRYMYGYSAAPYVVGYEEEKIPYTESTLTISVIDRKSNRLIWRGWNVERVSGSEPLNEGLKKDIKEIFKNYPVTGKK